MKWKRRKGARKNRGDEDDRESIEGRGKREEKMRGAERKKEERGEGGGVLHNKYFYCCTFTRVKVRTFSYVFSFQFSVKL